MKGPVCRPVRMVGVVCLTALGLFLAGCTGGGVSNGENGASASESQLSAESKGYEPATESFPAQNVPVPRMPLAARLPTEDGMDAALVYWWETLFYLRQTGDFKPMEELYDTNCGICLSQMIQWGEIYSQGGWAVTGPAEVQIEVSTLEGNGRRGSIRFLVSEAPAELYGPDGERYEKFSDDGSTGRPWVASLVFDDEARNWQVEEIGERGL